MCTHTHTVIVAIKKHITCTSTLVDKLGVVQASSGPCRIAETSPHIASKIFAPYTGKKNDLCFVDSFEDLLKRGIHLGKKDKCTQAQYSV